MSTNLKPAAPQAAGTLTRVACSFGLAGLLCLLGAAAQADTVAPTAQWFSPRADAGDVDIPRNPKLILAFNEPVQKGVGDIVINAASGADISISVTDDQVSVLSAPDSHIVTIDPTDNLTANTAYSVQVDSGAFEDLAGNVFAGISDTTTWEFETGAVVDTTAPTVDTLRPLDDLSSVPTNTRQIVLTFNESVRPRPGFSFREVTLNGGDAERWFIAMGRHRALVWLRVNGDLEASTAYHVRIAPGAFEDFAGNAFAGITDAVTWNFTTAANAAGSVAGGKGSDEDGVADRVIPPLPTSYGVGDFDGDALDEVLLRNAETGKWAYFDIGDDGALRHEVALAEDQTEIFTGIGDFDGNGRDDVLLRNATDGRWSYHEMRMAGVAASTLSLTRKAVFGFVGTGDFNADGRDDILLRNTTTGRWVYYEMDGVRSTLRQPRGMTPSLAWEPVAALDFNGNGRDGILLRHTTKGLWVYYEMDGIRSMLRRPRMTRNLAWDPVGVGDFNGDGRDDILLRHTDDGAWIWYQMADAGLTLRRIPHLPRDSSHALTGVGAFGDTHDQILLRHGRREWSRYPIEHTTGTVAESVSGLQVNLPWVHGAALSEDPAVAVRGYAVTIADTKLRARVFAILNKNGNESELFEADMEILTSLSASGVRDLAGLEFALNLRILELPNARVINLAPLASLANLRSLDLGLVFTAPGQHLHRRGSIIDITPLRSLVKLTHLRLNHHRIADISPLALLQNLTDLRVTGNPIDDISPLAGLTNLERLEFTSPTPDLSWLPSLTKLTHLDISDSNITDISPLAGLTGLSYLWLSGNQIADISPIAGMTRLTELSLGGNQVTSISHLTNLAALKELYIEYNTIEDISALAGATGLKRLVAFNNGIEDISPLATTSLEVLSIANNRIADLTPLEGMTSITGLYLGGNQVSDISTLAGLTRLNELGLNQNRISDLSSLADLTDLTRLYLGGNQVSDISTLARLTRLTELSLSQNRISDLSSLADLTDLTRLYLTSSQVSDISTLARLTRLTELDLDRNRISDLSSLAGLTSLSRLFLADNTIVDVSPLASLKDLSELYLEKNAVANVEALGQLTGLAWLDLSFNDITDASALGRLTGLAGLDLRGNPLNDASKQSAVRSLAASGTAVKFDDFTVGNFDIEVVLLDDFSTGQASVWDYIARRWMAVVWDDVPAHHFAQGWSGTCGGNSIAIPAGDRVDDLRVYVSKFDGSALGATGTGGIFQIRESGIPIFGCVQIDLEIANMLVTGLHEFGHVLGIGSGWRNSAYFGAPDGDTHFKGPQAITAFNRAGGSGYTGAKVPLQQPSEHASGGSHWRYSVLPNELMGPYGGESLSAITVEALGDLGYGVNVGHADPYRVREIAASKSSSKRSSHPVPIREAEPLPSVGAVINDGVQTKCRGRLGVSRHTHSHMPCVGHTHLEQPPIEVVDARGRVLDVLEN